MPSLHDTLLCLSAALLGLVKAEAAVFYPNVNLTDTSGKLIQAHGGAIIQTKNAEARGGSTWYWFGQDDTTDTSFDGFLGVTCYRSEDMLAWDYLGHALSPEEGTPISNTSVVERPKVLYNAKNDEYVMWFHLDNNDYRYAWALTASPLLSGATPLLRATATVFLLWPLTTRHTAWRR